MKYNGGWMVVRDNRTMAAMENVQALTIFTPPGVIPYPHNPAEGCDKRNT
jgi:hypothetical protein